MQVMLQYEASDVTGDQMPDQVNVTFSTETKSLTKLNLRRSRHFNLDIPLHTLATDQEGILHRHKVKTRPKKDLGFYQDITNKAVFRIQRSSEKSANKESKFNMKGEFLLNASKCLFDSERKTLKKPWRTMSLKAMPHSTTRPSSTTTFDQYVYNLEILKTTTFDLFDARIPLMNVTVLEERTVRMNAINIRDMHMKSTDRKSNRSKLRSAPQSRRRRNSVQGYYPQSRRRRKAVQDYYVDVAAVIDYKRYSKFLAQANYNNFTAMQDILEYYAFVLSAVDMLYQGIKHSKYTIHILLSKVYVLQTVASSSFIDKNARGDELNGNTASISLQDFISGAGQGVVGIYDHVILFTGYNLSRVDSNKNKKDILGFTNTGQMCRTDGRSSSVIEDRQGYSTSTIDAVAHELAHSLSAKHDGEKNACKTSDRYIMGSTHAVKKPGTEFNPWRFSSCSVTYFTRFLRKALKTSRGHICLVYAIEASADIPDVSDKLLGQLVKPDQQCQQWYGNNSYYCRGFEENITAICHTMFCADMLKGFCVPQAALTGTSCGNGKICINGQCVSDPYAPQLDENCVFGDTPDETCYSHVNEFIGYCYIPYNYRQCCDSCNNVSRPVRGCEYGDRIMSCTQDHCLNSKEDCCGTCNYGTPFTPTYSTRRSTPKRVATTANPRMIFTSIKECEPGDQNLRPELCTNISVCLIQPTQCCNYCSSLYSSATTNTTSARPLIPPTSPKKCEPGDLDLRPELCTNTSVCLTNRSQCCDYCSLHYNSSTTSTTQVTSPNECVLGEPDLSPQLCTSPSICQTQPLMCCNYCSLPDNSASTVSLYDIWIFRCFCIAFYFVSKQMSIR
ncbi:uncharacterized protein LOC106053118 isoform X2 [Biomphalaria glabrata]|uniref:Uncharacterized protein LOC106053118 isoform X2 n=1 Tax=Biomphalaria glabrata TaxID=6526 RepID=A0A9W3AIK8_BIOGL|nr:uncharacterized protein LOC106053118 isoform X2 [Biomphalaria glabrata]